MLAAAGVLLAGVVGGGLLAGGQVNRQAAPDPTPSAVAGEPAGSPALSDPGNAAPQALAPTVRPAEGPRSSPAPPAQAVTPAAWGLPAGWQYSLVCDEESGDASPCALHLIDDTGREQEGWPVTIRGDCVDGVAVGPQHAAFVACTRNRSAVVTGLDETGKPLPGWPVTVPGGVASSSWNDFAWGGVDSAAVGPDGTVYLAVSPNDDSGGYAIHAFSPDGSPRNGWPRKLPGGAQGFMLASDGTIVAWWYEGVQESIDLQARRTVFAVIGPDGRNLPGWPKGSTGAASGPVVWRDGSIYYTSATGKVYGHDRTGAIIDGWPYRLPFPVAPELRSDGALVFVGESDVVVLDRRGRMVPGWPYETRATLLAPGCDTPGFPEPMSLLAPDGTLHLAPWDGARSSVVALDPSGRTVAGWPYGVPDGWRVTGLDLGSRGTLTAALSGDNSCGGGLDATSIELTAAGSLVGDPPATPLSRVYEALRLEKLRTGTGATTFPQGSRIDLEFDLVNQSSSTVILPRIDDDGDRYYAAGTLQTWIERLGPEPDMGCLPTAGRKGTWYATGGWINVSEMPVAIPPGGSMPPLFAASLSPDLTSCLPPGAYRYHVEYKPLEGGEDDVVDHRAIAVTITAGPGNPPPTPRATPTMTPPPTPRTTRTPAAPPTSTVAPTSTAAPASTVAPTSTPAPASTVAPRPTGSPPAPASTPAAS
jgi:hypothetical protein